MANGPPDQCLEPNSPGLPPIRLDTNQPEPATQVDSAQVAGSKGAKTMRTITYTELAAKLLTSCPGYPEAWASREQLIMQAGGRYTSRLDFATRVLRSVMLGTTQAGFGVILRILCEEGLLQEFHLSDK